MHLNELLRAHQVEVTNASAAREDAERNRHLDQVAFPAKHTVHLPPPISPAQVNSDVGVMDVSLPSTKDHPSWDNEGGAIAQPVTRMPDNAPLRMPPHYFVGSEEYSDLTSALKAHAKQKLGEER